MNDLNNRVLTACVTFFVAAMLLWAAVKIIASIWLWLLGMTLFVALLAGTIWYIRWRHRRW